MQGLLTAKTEALARRLLRFGRMTRTEEKEWGGGGRE